MDNFIPPAYNAVHDGIHVSKEDFQEQLQTWLERNGMLDELRGHFRANLFKVLKNTPVGRTFASGRRSAFSSRDRALLLLVSECLHKLGCHFALSVFCVEAPLEKSAQERFSASGGRVGEWKFSPDDTYDIVASLGVPRGSDRSLAVSSAYFDGEESLLSCMLSLCGKSVSSHDRLAVAPEASTVRNNYNTFVNDIETILLGTNINPGQLVDVRKCVSRFLGGQNDDVLKVKEECRKHLTRYKLKIGEIRKTLDDERMKVYTEFVKTKPKEMDGESKDVTRADKFDDGTNKVSSKQRVTSEGNFDNTKVDGAKFVDKILQTDATEDRTTTAKRERNFYGTFQTIVTDNQTLRESLAQLRKDNATLKSQNENYIEQMKELSSRAAILMNELDNSQQEIIKLKDYIETLRVNTFATTRRVPSHNATGERRESQTAPIMCEIT